MTLRKKSRNGFTPGSLWLWTIGLLVLTLLVGWLSFIALNSFFAGTPGIEMLKVILTVIAGLGGVVYLVVRFRTQIINEADDRRKEVVAKREEEQFIEDKLFRAIEMLGAEAPSTKIAGIYALTDVSDTYGGRYKQRVVDILCGYLRSHRSESESSIESTIWNTIENHTNKTLEEDGKSWSDIRFELMDSTFHQIVRLRDCSFNKSINFQGSHFEKGLAVTIDVPGLFMHSCTFDGDARFDNSQFSRLVMDESRFNNEANFLGVRVSGGSSFESTVFSKHTDENGNLVVDAKFSQDFELDDRGVPEQSILRSNFKINMKKMVTGTLKKSDF